jgi:hypothetical protein
MKRYQINFSTSKGYAQGINYAGLKINPVNLVNIGDYQDIDPMTGKPRMSVGSYRLFSSEHLDRYHDTNYWYLA